MSSRGNCVTLLALFPFLSILNKLLAPGKVLFLRLLSCELFLTQTDNVSFVFQEIIEMRDGTYVASGGLTLSNRG